MHDMVSPCVANAADVLENWVVELLIPLLGRASLGGPEFGVDLKLRLIENVFPFRV